MGSTLLNISVIEGVKAMYVYVRANNVLDVLSNDDEYPQLDQTTCMKNLLIMLVVVRSLFERDIEDRSAVASCR